jgi:hypothetical protein
MHLICSTEGEGDVFMREPERIIAAIDIAMSVRNALADALDRHRTSGWEEDVLLIELGRVLGAVPRFQDVRPSAVEQMIDSLRRVYSGLNSHRTPDAAELVREMCPESSVQAGSGDAAGNKATVQ